MPYAVTDVFTKFFLDCRWIHLPRKSCSCDSCLSIFGFDVYFELGRFDQAFATTSFIQVSCNAGECQVVATTSFIQVSCNSGECQFA